MPLNSWQVVTSTHRGSKSENDDFALAEIHRARRGRYATLCVCDGVGSFPGSGKCAQAVGRAMTTILSKMLLRRKRSSLDAFRLRNQVATELRSHIPKKSPSDATTPLATTLAAGIVDRNSLLTIWAGDSRIYLLNEEGQLLLATKDHQDEQGRLSRWVQGDGQIAGRLEANSLRFSSRPVAVCATTDGVHEHCQREELRQFLLYCVLSGVRDSQKLQNDLQAFLNVNVCDNYSLSLWTTQAGRRRLASRGRRLLNP